MKLLSLLCKVDILFPLNKYLWFHDGFKHLFSDVGTVDSKLGLSEHSGTEWASLRSFSIPKLIKRADRLRDGTLATTHLQRGCSVYCGDVVRLQTDTVL